MTMESIVWAILFLFVLSSTFAADPNRPHKHQGLLDPYKAEKPSVKLTIKQKDALIAGKTVKDQILQGDGGRAMVIQDIHAPCEVVWDRILDFTSYPKMVPKVTQCENYERRKEADGSEVILTRMRLGVFGVKIEYYINHCYNPSLSTCTWTLDYNRCSDLDESVGYWYVEPHPDPSKPDWCRVYYSVALVPPSWIPGIVKSFLTKQALTQATAWVKENSEKKYAQMSSTTKPSII